MGRERAAKKVVAEEQRPDEGQADAQFWQRDILEGLSPEQRAVAEHERGVALVVAVAGAGKTTTMTRRIARLVGQGVDGEKILAITFTRSGAAAMNAKLEALGVRLRKAKGDGGVRVGTFHSLCLEIIRDDSPWKGYEVDDGDKMKFALKDLLGYRGMQWDDCDLTMVEGFIGWMKNEAGVDGDGRIKKDVLVRVLAEHAEWKDPRYAEALEKYERERHKRRLLTFDDMLCTAVNYLTADEGARARWAARYAHVMVDEFQDTNTAQMLLTEHLARAAESFMVVGDDDQLIYAWRGSRPEYTLGFEQKFGAKLYFMQTNYRSRPEVLGPANNVISLNQARISKQNLPARQAGGLVDVASCANSDDEAAHIADQIKAGVASGRTYKDHAVLYRTNALSRALEEAFIEAKIPHIVVGGMDFYSRKEVADLLAYLRLAVDCYDVEAFSRAVNRPFRYIGKASVDKLLALGERSPGGPMGLCSDPPRAAGLQWRQEGSLREFAGVVAELRSMVEAKARPDAMLSAVLDRTDYLGWLARDEGTDTSENSRVSNVKELVRTAGRFATAAAMLEYVDGIKQARKACKKHDEDEVAPDAVLLMTVHKAKGLEWPVVFLAGCSQGILPHARSTNIEEERRLFYVGITRAVEECRISAPVVFGVGGQGATKALAPSQFIGEAGLVLTAAPAAPARVDGPAAPKTYAEALDLLSGRELTPETADGLDREVAALEAAGSVAVPFVRTRLPSNGEVVRELAERTGMSVQDAKLLLVPARGEMAEQIRQDGVDRLLADEEEEDGPDE